MRLHSLAEVALVSAALVGMPALSTRADAQINAQITPIILWTAAGAVIGAVAWPVIVGGGTAAATGGFVNLGLPVGAVVGAAAYQLMRREDPLSGLRP